MAQQQNLLLVGDAINRGVSFSLGNTIDHRLYRAYGRGARSGKRIYADIPGKKSRENQHDRLGWIGRKFIAPMTFTGGCNTDVFNA